MEFKEICEFAIEKYGVSPQIIQLFEEFSELQKILCKHLRKKEEYGKTEYDVICSEIADEVADVEVMIMQMKTIFDIDEKVEERKKYKFIRQANRLFKNTKFYVCYNCSSVFETGVLNDGTAEEICNCKSCKNSNNLLTISEGIK